MIKQIEIGCASYPVDFHSRVAEPSNHPINLLDLVVRHSDDAIVITDAETIEFFGPRVIYVNEAFTRMTGYAPAEVVGKSLHLLRGPSTDSDMCDWIDLNVRDQIGFRSEIKNYTKNGTPFWVEIDVQPVTDGSGRVTNWVSIQRDITGRKERDERLRQSEQHYQRLVSTSPDCIKTLSLDGVILSINESGAAALEIQEPQSLIGSDWLTFVAGDERARAAAALKRATRGETVQFQAFCATSKGTPKWWDVVLTPLLDDEGVPEQVLSVSRDITLIKALLTEQKRLLDEANERAKRDALSGLYNYRVFHEALDAQAKRAAVMGTSLAVLELDIDNFKSFNDSYGHLAGDAAITQVAELLTKCSAAADARRRQAAGTEDAILVSRVGGDEFAILIPGATREDAIQLVRALKEEVDALNYDPQTVGLAETLSERRSRLIPFKISVGYALYPDDAISAIEAYRMADERALRDKIGSQSSGNHELRESFKADIEGFTILDALVTAVDNKDRYTRRHSEDVLNYSLIIAQEFEMTEEERTSLMIAALIHDVGKICVPDRILRQPGRLSKEEHEKMRQHVTVSAAMVSSVPGLAHTLQAVRHHHERWDGEGYPDRLAGEQIPLAARIIAVADAFSAMTTDRPFRKAVTTQAALTLLKRGSGTQWDPQCVRCLIKRLKANLD